MSDQEPQEQPKPLQDPDSDDLERGEYVESAEGQEAIWAEADVVLQCFDPQCEEPSIPGERFCEEHRFSE